MRDTSFHRSPVGVCSVVHIQILFEVGVLTVNISHVVGKSTVTELVSETGHVHKKKKKRGFEVTNERFGVSNIMQKKIS